MQSCIPSHIISLSLLIFREKPFYEAFSLGMIDLGSNLITGGNFNEISRLRMSFLLIRKSPLQLSSEQYSIVKSFTWPRSVRTFSHLSIFMTYTRKIIPHGWSPSILDVATNAHPILANFSLSSNSIANFACHCSWPLSLRVVCLFFTMIFNI